MVSYYNSLSSMFTNPTQPHPVARHAPPSPAAMAAAAHTSAYLHGYPAAAAYHQQFAAAAGHPASSASSSSQYSDLNSNMYGSSMAGAAVAAAGQFQDLQSNHQVHGGSTGGGAGSSWHAQSVWHPSSQFGSLPGPPGCRSASLAMNYSDWATSTTSLASPNLHQAPSTTPNPTSEVQNPNISESGTGQSSVQQAAAASTSGTEHHSPSSPGDKAQGSQPSPAFPSHSQSSGSPVGTPTPGYPHAQLHQQPQIQPPEVFPSKYGYPHSPSGMMQEMMPNPSSPGKIHHPSHQPHQEGLQVGLDPEGMSPQSPMSPGGPQSSSSRPQPARSPFEWMKKPSYTHQPDKSGRTRTKDKYRVVYSDHQRLELEKEFHYSRYITIRRKAELANSVGLSERQVKIWFQNRRAKERRATKKQDESLTKEKMTDPCLAMSAFTDSLQQYNAAGVAPGPPQMASGGHGAMSGPPGSHGGYMPPVGSSAAVAAAAAAASSPFGVAMKFE